MDAYTTPGQDLFEALQWEMYNSPEHAPRARGALYPDDPDDPSKRWTWGMMPAHVKAIFSAAAARFLAE